MADRSWLLGSFDALSLYLKFELYKLNFTSIFAQLFEESSDHENSRLSE